MQSARHKLPFPIQPLHSDPKFAAWSRVICCSPRRVRLEELIDAGVRKLAIDLTGLNSIDGAGIGTLVNCGGQMDERGGQIRLAGAHDAVAKVFTMVHMDRILPLASQRSRCGACPQSSRMMADAERILR
jgi:anti-anti-sigma factor